MIHPTAIIHPKAKVHPTAKVGPYAVIDADVELGANCIVGPHVYLTGVLKMGAHNQFHASCVIGDAPQDLKYDGAPTVLRIGDNNVFREHVTIHRATKPDGETVIGSRNFLMAGCHIGHNCQVANDTIICNGVLIAGHAQVHDKVFMSAHCLVHQFTRIGTLAIMQGGTRISQDVPPYTVACDGNGICGLNVIGLRRAGMSPDERMELKKLYKLIFRSGINYREAIARGREEFKSPAAITMMDFVASAKKGVCFDVGANKSSEAEEE